MLANCFHNCLKIANFALNKLMSELWNTQNFRINAVVRL